MCETLITPGCDPIIEHVAGFGRQHNFSTSGCVSERIEFVEGASNPTTVCAETAVPEGPENWQSSGRLMQDLLRRGKP